MANKAQIRIVRQQERVEACFVRAVARCAFAGNHGGMFALDILDFLARVSGVARIAEKPLFCHDHPRDVAAVGVMTFEALAVFEKLVVRAFYGLLHKFTVAFGAQLRVISRGEEQVFYICSMGRVATITLAVDERLMGICPGKLPFSINMTFVTGHVHPVF
jgi:hypothetical protein